MSAVPIPIPGPSPEPVFRLTVEQYHAMIETGVLTDDDPVELLEGILVFKIPKNPQHRMAMAKLQRTLTAILPESLSLQMQEPITLADSEPEPDATVFRGLPEDYLTRHPGPQEIDLVAEVADSSLRRDRGIKQRTYARAGIAVYWIVNLEERCVEVRTRPDAAANPPAYLDTRVFDGSQSVPLEISGKAIGQISVASILP